MTDLIEVMRVQRMLPKGELRVEANGGILSDLDSLDRRQRFLFLTAVGELIGFVGGYQVLVDAGVAPPLPAEAQPTAVSEPQQPDDAPLTPEQQAFLDKLENEKNALLQDDSHLQEPSILRTAIPLRRPAKQEAPAPTAQPTGIVAQINALLQARLQQDDALKNETIRLKNVPGGKTQIEVNGRLYPNPKAIEDPKIQQLIQLALRDWEKR